MNSNSGYFISFNQEFSCLSVASKNVYQIYNCDPFGIYYSQNNKDFGIGIVEMLFSTKLVAIVGNSEETKRKLLLVNIERNSINAELSFPSEILAIRINRERIVIVLEKFIYIYDIGEMSLLKTISTCPNPNALCSLSPSTKNSLSPENSPSPDNCYLAYPEGTTLSGKLVVYDAIQTKEVCTISAHKSALNCIQFNYSGELIATASEKGTIIRVHKSNNGDLLYQFRRGTFPAHIYSLSFDLTDTFLGVSSDSDTIHIFKLRENKNNGEEPKHKLIDGVKNKVSSLLISDAQRDFAFGKIPKQSIGTKSICAIGKNFQVMVAVEDGKFYQYSLNIEKGGECILSKEYSFIDP